MKNPPHTYLQKLRSYLDPAVTRKVNVLLLTFCPFPLAWLFHSCMSSFPSDPPSLVQDIPTAEERSHTGLLQETTSVTKQAAVRCSEKGDSCLFGTPWSEKPLPSLRVIKQDKPIPSCAALWLERLENKLEGR